MTRNKTGRCVQNPLKSPEQRCLKQHSRKLAITGNAIEHFNNTVIRIGGVLVVLPEQKRICSHNSGVCEPAEEREKE